MNLRSICGLAVLLGVVMAAGSGCSSRAPESENGGENRTPEVGVSQSTLINCPAGSILECTVPDPSDGFHGKKQCACVNDPAIAPAPPPPPPDNTRAISQEATSVNTQFVFTAVNPVNPGAYPLSAFAYPTELAGQGCTQTAYYQNGPNDTVGGRLWICPLHADGTKSNITSIGGTLCPSGWQQEISEPSTVRGGYVGAPASNWYFLAESCRAPHDDPFGMSCGGPCMST